LRSAGFSQNLASMTRVRLAALAAILAGATACGMDDPCARKGDACGGDPSGSWILTDSCRDPAFQNPEAVTYYDQTQTMARQPPPEPTSSDWCSDLSFDTTNGLSFMFPRDTLAFNPGGDVTYDGAGAYATKLLVAGSGSVDLSASCLSRLFAFQCAPADATTPADVHSLADDLTAYSIRIGVPEQNIACSDDGSGGCFCAYTIKSEPTGGGLSGRWSTQGSLLTHFGGNNLIPSQADICVTGDTMTMWGHDRTGIWDQAGLRAVTLMRVN
jgi:hypothetical protein